MAALLQHFIVRSSGQNYITFVRGHFSYLQSKFPWPLLYAGLKYGKIGGTAYNNGAVAIGVPEISSRGILSSPPSYSNFPFSFYPFSAPIMPIPPFYLILSFRV